jgi:type VI secretion system protein ImpL
MVRIVAFPTGTNPEAHVRPHSTVLEMQCIDSTTRLENMNFPVNKIFNWSPRNCGDVTFQIAIGELLLTNRYTGSNAFSEFLNDFKTGERTFRRADFPLDEAALKRMGVSYIRAKYRFEGQFSDAIGVRSSAPGAPPRKIVPCWD